MTEIKRKLAAIMFTDIVEFTALSAKDEERAFELIQKQRLILKPIVIKFGGEWLKEMGDGLLLSFPSSKHAVNCAIEIQHSVKHIEGLNLRIGIHQGDILVKDGDIYGDDVNVASRIEPFSAVGGIAISDKVQRDIASNPEFDIQWIAQPSLKGVMQEVKVYCITSHNLPMAKVSSVSAKLDQTKTVWYQKKVIKFTATITLMCLMAMVVFMLRQKNPLDAPRKSLAVMSFENLSDVESEKRLGQILQELFITDLSDISALKVFSSQRLFDIQKQLGHRNNRFIDPSLAIEVAKKAGAQNMLTGNVIDVSNRKILTCRLLDVNDGSIIKTRKVEGIDIWLLVDDLSSLIRSDLEITEFETQVNDLPLKQKTTTSMKAYNHYIAGVDYLNKQAFNEAINELNEAIEIDSTFNRAYYKLAIAQWWGNPDEKNESAVISLNKILESPRKPTKLEMEMVQVIRDLVSEEYDKAKDSLEKLVHKESEDKEIWYALGESYFHSTPRDNLKALNAFEIALELDPELTLVYGHIFDIFTSEGLYHRGIRLAKKYISSFPNEIIGYNTLGKMYKLNGQLDLADETLKIAYKIAPGDPYVIANEANLLRRHGKFEDAIRMAKSIWKIDSPSRDEVYVVAALCIAHSYEEMGRYSEALSEVFKQAPVLNSDKSDVGKANILINIAERYRIISEFDSANVYLGRVLKLKTNPFIQAWVKLEQGLIASETGAAETLKSVLEEVKKLVNQKISGWEIYEQFRDVLQVEYLDLSARTDKALSLCRKLDNDAPFYVHDYYLFKEAMLNIKNSMFREALKVADRMLKPFKEERWGAFNRPRSYYVKGRAYEAMGEIDKALKNYKKLLDLWKNADDSIPVLINTQERLKNIQVSNG